MYFLWLIEGLDPWAGEGFFVMEARRPQALILSQMLHVWNIYLHLP